MLNDLRSDPSRSDGEPPVVQRSTSALRARKTGGRPMRILSFALALLTSLSTAAAAQESFITERRPINWEDTLRHPVLEWNLEDKQDEAVRKSLVPVLLPNVSESMPEHLQITAGSGWYAASINPDGDHVVFVTGTSLWTWPVGGAPPDLPDLRSGDLHATHGEGIVEVDFSAFGAAYNINVECYRPFTDQRCIKGDYILGLTKSLVIARR